MLSMLVVIFFWIELLDQIILASYISLLSFAANVLSFCYIFQLFVCMVGVLVVFFT